MNSGIEGHKIIGEFDGRTVTYTIPDEYVLSEEEASRRRMVLAFETAVEVSSRPEHVDKLLNNYLGVLGGKTTFE